MSRGSEVVIVANRLPVDQVSQADGTIRWQRSPGGLVTALEPFIRGRNGAWVGWSGSTGAAPEPFDSDGIHLVPVPLDAEEIARYYEGFSNAALWPLYHDAVERPQYHRSWWDSYVSVNHQFARQAAEIAADTGVVWIHDYQLQLVPQMLRDLRPDLRIGFFLHIPFPPMELFMQLPWRRRIIDGLLGADLIGFQRPQGATNFLQLARVLSDLKPSGGTVVQDGRTVTARAFPISIDADSFDSLANSAQVRARAADVRTELGKPDRVILGVDRLDYTKGIGVRLRAFGELLRDGKLSAPDTVLVQVATPSRERVKHYITMREEIERMVGNINGEFGSISSPAIHYLHQSLPREELAALYRAADVMVVTPYRDGMNLVAKEYVAARGDLGGALVLSEFAGAAAEFRQAYLVNPHDINGVKDAMFRALFDAPADQRRRMRTMRRHLFAHDLEHWAQSFFDALRLRGGPVGSAEEGGQDGHDGPGGVDALDGSAARSSPDMTATLDVKQALADIATRRPLLVVSDFDGTLSPIVADPADAAMGDGALTTLLRLTTVPGVHVGVISGRAYDDLVERVGIHPDVYLVGSHGAEYGGPADPGHHGQRNELVAELQDLVSTYEGARLEIKPVSVSVHTRQMPDREAAIALRDAALAGPAAGDGRTVKVGKEVIEIAVVAADKGVALRQLIEEVSATAVIFLGDDVTDEDAFAVLATNDVGIKVGEGETRAGYRVPDTAAVVAALDHLVREVRRAVPTDAT